MKITGDFLRLWDEAIAAGKAAQDRDDKLMESALRGGPFWGEGKPSVGPGDLVGLADFVPGPPINALPPWLNTEPMVTVLEALNTITEAVCNYTGRTPVRALVIDEEWGINLGILPGRPVTIATAAGLVEIRVDRRPRRDSRGPACQAVTAQTASIRQTDPVTSSTATR